MNDQHDDVHDLVGAYALDALSTEEQAEFEAHLRTCARCRAEVAELRQVVDVLPLAAQSVEPSAQLRGRILTQARAESGPELRSMAGGAPRDRPPRPQGIPAWLRSAQTWVAAAAAAAIIGLGIWNFELRGSSSQPSAFDRQVVAALASGASVSSLHGTANAPGASAALVRPKRGSAYLIVAGLPAIPGNRVYELWFMRNAVPKEAGTFTYSGTAAQVVPVPRPQSDYTLTAVTDEPKPGRPKPTGKAVLSGKLVA